MEPMKNVEMGLNFKEMCRLCMGTESDMLPLFVEQESLLERIMNLIPALKLCSEDGLPIQVCSQCVQQVHECYNFKLQCETTDAALRDLLVFKPSENQNLGAITVKEEPDISITIEEGPLHFNNYDDLSCSMDKDGIKLENEEKHETAVDVVDLQQQVDLIVQNIMKTQETSSVAPKRICRKKKYTCSECGKQFPVPNELKRHMISHTGEKNFICKFCGKRYSFSQSLMHHYKEHADEKPFECNNCDEKFSFQIELKKHAESHIQHVQPGITKIVCHICGQLLANNQSLRYHMLTHTGERPFTCSICKKSYAKQYMEMHMRIHSGERPYVCDLCGARFAQKPVLRAHKLTHTGERKYICEQCGKKFKTKANLQSHNFSHTGEREYECEVCNKKFSFKYSLVKHIRRLHMGNQTYPCPTCGERFVQKDYLHEHILCTHSEQNP